MTNYIYNNNNPRGIKNGADCVARAVSHALGIKWSDSVMELTKLGIELGRAFNEAKTYDKFLSNNGWKKERQPRKPNGKKYTVSEFCQLFPIGSYVVSVSNHLTFVEDGKCYDTFDCTYKTVGNFWSKL